MTTIGEILESIRSYSPDADLQPVMSAYLLAARAHAGQKRKSGEPYLTHPLAVAEILSSMRMDTDTIATALLHDALEDNPITKQEMSDQIGPEITELVDGVTKIGKLRFRSKEELQAENFRKMMLAMSKDLRVILVKLADRLHNMRTLEHHSDDKRRSIAEETRDIYVPIANRLGLVRLKTELEDLCFEILEEEEYGRIDRFLADTQIDRDRYIQRVVRALRDELEPHAQLEDVKGRVKHRFSIYKKMQAQGLQVHEVPDVLAFRIIVGQLADCYAVLGLIHASFPPVPDRIKYYIARPKANGYQSLHTTVIGPEGRRIEVQIRTRQMHRIAEEGIAAHWQYKEGRLALSREDVARISRVRELFESAQEAESATEFMETVKVEFYNDHVFVFTPAGDIKQFPAGATALDFAYAVHTDVGHHCTGAKVNGRMVPFRYHLQSGDAVEILTSPNQKPNRDWLEIARTGRAIQKIRRYLRQEERDLGIRLGREMVEAELKRSHWNLARVKTEGRLKEALDKYGYRELDAMFVDVARGQLGLRAIVTDLLPERDPASSITSIFNRFRARTQSPVLISGDDVGVLVTFAKCCSPLPGEPVAGFITRGRGISVHKFGCPRLADMDPERRIPVEWKSTPESRHSGEIQVVCSDRPGLLANISEVCAHAQININRAEARNIGDNLALCTLELAIRDVGELARLVKNLEKIPGVESVQRIAQ